MVSCFRAGSLERRRREVVKALRAIREAMAGDMMCISIYMLEFLVYVVARLCEILEFVSSRCRGEAVFFFVMVVM